MENFSSLLTTSDVAKILGNTPREISRAVRRGDIEPHFKAPGLRGAMFFDPAEVEHYRAMRELQNMGKTKAHRTKAVG